MRIPIIALTLCASLLSTSAISATCEEHQLSMHSASTLAERRLAMSDEIIAFQRIAEESLGFRAAAIRFYGGLETKLASGAPLSGADLKTLNEGAVSMLSQRAALMGIAEAHECWIKQTPSADPDEAALQRAGIVMSLSAALLLYDNYLAAIAPYRNNHELRQHLNRKDSGFELHAGTLNTIAASYASVENRQRVRHAIQWYEAHGKAPGTQPLEGYRYVQQLVEQSPSLTMVRKISPLRDLGSQLDFSVPQPSTPSSGSRTKPPISPACSLATRSGSLKPGAANWTATRKSKRV